jgi:hypothetical protein
MSAVIPTDSGVVRFEDRHTLYRTFEPMECRRCVVMTCLFINLHGETFCSNCVAWEEVEHGR